MIDDSCIAGCVLGTAVGDALGLPYEGVSRDRLPRLLGPPDRHRFFFRRGMISDDTEHTCLVVQSLIASGFDVDAFTTDFARRLRWWFATLPAGLGKATLRSCLRLWLGFPPNRSGVNSAGNGPAMRSAIFGACIDDVDTLVRFVRASARITHRDVKAEYGAMAVAMAVHYSRHQSEINASDFLSRLADRLPPDGEELLRLLHGAAKSVAAGKSTLHYARTIGCENGVSGYTYHTVPVAVHAWLTSPADYRRAVTSVIECGGDADTTAAIVGGIVGCNTGEQGIPSEWLDGILEWPNSVRWMRQLSRQLAETLQKQMPGEPPTQGYFSLCCRNLLFLTIVLIHGFRRFFPPY